MKTLRIDEIKTTTAAGAQWIPLRAELGVSAFGLSAYRGGPGDQLVPRHQETGAGAGGHEEVYVVTRGRATFVLDGETVDAAAGTCIFVEPGEMREARADEPGTTVVAIGARRDEPYRIAPWEYGSQAARARQLGRVGELERVVDEGIATYGEHVTMLLGKACVAAQRGERDEALELLDRAASDEDFGDWARREAASEPLLDSVRDDPRFPR
jgi:AraC-like ligand binding domain